MKRLHPIFSLLLVGLVVPQIALAVWWNPFTWKIFSRPRPSIMQEKELATTTPQVASTTPTIVKSRDVEVMKTPIQSNINPQSVKTQAKTPVVATTLTKEQIAIHMATDIEYQNSPLDKATRQEIDKNWESIKKYYTGKRGKDTVEGMYKDILDAHAKWFEESLRQDPVARVRFCSTLEDSVQKICMDAYLPYEERLLKESLQNKPSYQIEQLQREVRDMRYELERQRQKNDSSSCVLC